MRYQTIFVWEAFTLDGECMHGVERDNFKYQVVKKLSGKGLFKINVQLLPVALTKKVLKTDILILFIQELQQINASGVTLINSLNMMIGNHQTPIIKYILVSLKLSLEEGESLTKSFRLLKPVFNDFFVAMIDMSEKSDNLAQGFAAILTFFQQRQKQYRAIQKQIRYPLIVLGIALFLILGMIVFVLPMFQNIYLLYGQDLPTQTVILLNISNFVNNQWHWLLSGLIVLVFWYKIPGLCYIHPLFLAGKWVRNLWFLNQDQLLFAHCMTLLLKSGKTAYHALQDISSMVSIQNQKQVLQVQKQLEAGERFSDAFLKNKWFPVAFHRLIAVSEASGDLAIGFHQVYQYLEKQMENRFNKFVHYIEPALMIILGGLVLFVLLSVYLPVFDLGNQVF